MILIEDNFLTELEIDLLLENWDKYPNNFSNQAINFYSVDFIFNKVDYSFLHHGKFTLAKFEKVRLQLYNDSFNQIEEYHGHENLHNYIIFLNDNFIGGELEFKLGITVRPKKGSLVYFNNNELHRVLPCKGDRYVFTLLGNTPADLKFKHLSKKLF